MSVSPKDRAVLVGYSQSGQEVFQTDLSLYDYYESLYPVVDSDEERRRLGIRKLTGRLYDGEGRLTQHWANTYGLSDELAASVEVFFSGNGDIDQVNLEPASEGGPGKFLASFPMD